MRACLVATIAVALSCAKHGDEPKIPGPVGETHTYSALAHPEDAGVRNLLVETVRMDLTTRVREACHLPPPPHEASAFDFDGVDVKPRGEDVLRLVASCLTTPALSERRLCVAGYADPRLPAAYEEALARAHASAAKRYLAEAGVDANRSDTVLRYEPVFVGDERTRALVRRVEIDIQDSVACPGR